MGVFMENTNNEMVTIKVTSEFKGNTKSVCKYIFLFWLGAIGSIFTLGYTMAVWYRAITKWRVEKTVINGKELIFTGKSRQVWLLMFLTGLLGVFTLGFFLFYAVKMFLKWEDKNTFIKSYYDERVSEIGEQFYFEELSNVQRVEDERVNALNLQIKQRRPSFIRKNRTEVGQAPRIVSLITLILAVFLVVFGFIGALAPTIMSISDLGDALYQILNIVPSVNVGLIVLWLASFITLFVILLKRDVLTNAQIIPSLLAIVLSLIYLTSTLMRILNFFEQIDTTLALNIATLSFALTICPLVMSILAFVNLLKGKNYILSEKEINDCEEYSFLLATRDDVSLSNRASGISSFDGSAFAVAKYVILFPLCVLGSIFTLGFTFSFWVKSFFSWTIRKQSINGRTMTFSGSSFNLWAKMLIGGLLTPLTFGIYSVWYIRNIIRWRSSNTNFR